MLHTMGGGQSLPLESRSRGRTMGVPRRSKCTRSWLRCDVKASWTINNAGLCLNTEDVSWKVLRIQDPDMCLT